MTKKVKRKASPEYRAYRWAKDIGARGTSGIECRFTSFKHFLAVAGRQPTSAHVLYRKNQAGHWEPGNICWATRVEQREWCHRRAATYKPVAAELETQIDKEKSNAR